MTVPKPRPRAKRRSATPPKIVNDGVLGAAASNSAPPPWRPASNSAPRVAASRPHSGAVDTSSTLVLTLMPCLDCCAARLAPHGARALCPWCARQLADEQRVLEALHALDCFDELLRLHLCARLPPLVFVLHTRRCTRARSCATPQSSRRTTDGWCARFRARSGRRLHRRRALRLGRGASPTRSNARPLLLRPVCMPLLLALTQRVLAARRPGVPAACIADALRRARRRCVPLRAAVRRAPGVCPRATGYARRHAFLSRRRPRRARRRTADVRRAVASCERRLIGCTL